MIAALDDAERAITEKVGEPVTLPALKRFLARTQVTLERAVSAATPAGSPGDRRRGSGGNRRRRVGPDRPGRRGRRSRGMITSRQEVIACLDRIIEFYDRTEPASPVPYLARRMRRMVPMDFLKLMEDLAPSGLKEFRLLAGLSDDKKAARSSEVTPHG